VRKTHFKNFSYSRDRGTRLLFSVTAGVVVLAVFKWAGDYLDNFQGWPDEKFLNGVLGAPHLDGTYEGADRPLSVLFVLVGALIAYGILKLPDFLGQRPAIAKKIAMGLLVVCGLGYLFSADSWMGRASALWVLVLLPWGTVAIPRIKFPELPLVYRRILKWVGVPLLLYGVSFRYFPYAIFEVPHEGDIFNAAQDLLAGKVPYRDTFIPHGIGNAYLGALGMKWIAPNVEGFRLAYAMASPLNPVLFYFLFLFLFGMNAWQTAIFALAAHILSGLHLPFMMGHITWFGGIRTLFSLATLTTGAALLGYRSIVEIRYPRFVAAVTLLSLFSAASLWMNIENGVGSAIFVVSLFALLSVRARIYLWLGLPVFFVGFGLFAILFLGAFGPVPVLLTGIYGHIVDFPVNFALFWSEPLFRPYRTVLEKLLIFYPLATFAMALAVVAIRRQKLFERPVLLFLLPACAFAYAIYQISVIRSDRWHFQVGLAATGIPLVLILTQLNDRKSLSRIFVILIATFVAVGNWKDFGTPFNQNNLSPTFPSSKMEGEYGVLSAEQQDMLRQAQDYFKQRPDLGNEAFFLSDYGALFKVFLEMKDVSNLTLFHYLLSESDQRSLIAKIQRQSTKMVFFSRIPWHGDFPLYARLPLVTQYVNRNYSPCVDFTAAVTLLVRNDLATGCPLAGNTRVSRVNYPDYDSLRKLPSYLASHLDGSPYLEGLELLEVTLKKNPLEEHVLQVEWKCNTPRSVSPVSRVSFDVRPGVKRYLIPTAANPNWAYCVPRRADISLLTYDRKDYPDIDSFHLYVKRTRRELRLTQN